MYHVGQVIVFASDHVNHGVVMKRAISKAFEMAAAQDYDPLLPLDSRQHLFDESALTEAFVMLATSSTRYRRASMEDKIRMADLISAFFGPAVEEAVAHQVLYAAAKGGEWAELSDLIGKHFASLNIRWEKNWIKVIHNVVLIF